VAYCKVQDGASSKVSYIEVENAQHFDTRFVPLHVYFVRAMDAMYATLKSGAALPPSQVVRTTGQL
jgi:hydroxybutyrate-dimer hydrolase